MGSRFQQLEDLFNQAVSMPAAARAEWARRTNSFTDLAQRPGAAGRVRAGTGHRLKPGNAG